MYKAILLLAFMGGTVASWLVHSTPHRTVWVRALAWDIALCSRVRHFQSHSASLHPGVQMDTGEFNAGGNPTIG